MRLASQHEARVQVAALEAVVLVHAYLARQDLGAAGAAHPAFAGVGQLDAGPQRRVQDGRIIAQEFHLALYPVESDRDQRVRRVAGLDVMVGPAIRHAEAFYVDALAGQAARPQC
jgi:hypothetical protein